MKMVNVKYPFSMCLDWNPSYSYCEIPKDYQGEIPEHWRRLAIPVPEEKGIPQVKNLIIRNVISEMNRIMQEYPEHLMLVLFRNIQ